MLYIDHWGVNTIYALNLSVVVWFFFVHCKAEGFMNHPTQGLEQPAKVAA